MTSRCSLTGDVDYACLSIEVRDSSSCTEILTTTCSTATLRRRTSNKLGGMFADLYMSVRFNDLVEASEVY
jgi:hypothetical protein